MVTVFSSTKKDQKNGIFSFFYEHLEQADGGLHLCNWDYERFVIRITKKY
jgi:hypothetical protein